MTPYSLFRVTVFGASLSACVSQYTSPGGEVESTSTESPAPPPEEPGEASAPSESSSPSKTSDSSSEAERAPSEASGTCDDRTCVSTTDCCSGYQCSFDPERSKVIRYCLPQ